MATVVTAVRLGGVAGFAAASVGGLVLPAGVVACVVAGGDLDGVKVGKPPFGSEESSSVVFWCKLKSNGWADLGHCTSNIRLNSDCEPCWLVVCF